MCSSVLTSVRLIINEIGDVNVLYTFTSLVCTNVLTSVRLIINEIGDVKVLVKSLKFYWSSQYEVWKCE